MTFFSSLTPSKQIRLNFNFQKPPETKFIASLVSNGLLSQLTNVSGANRDFLHQERHRSLLASHVLRRRRLRGQRLAHLALR